MSSLLSFAFRDNNKNNIKNNKNNNNNKSLKNRDIRIPDVEPSRSGDNVMSPTASMDLGEQQQATAQTTTPATPEGLKPRKSLKAIRRELGIPSLLPPSQQLLPPRPLMVHSPQVTNSSFYSRESATTTPSGKHSQRIAESPNLAAPTTAVGALVASTTHTNRAPAPLYHKPLLPPRHWLLDDDDVEEHLVVQQRSRQYYSHMHDDSFEPRTMQMQMQLRQYRQLDDDQSDDDQSSQDDDDHLRWQPLMESADTSSSFGASSQVGLVEERQATTGYNFDPILNLNVSAISKPADDQSSLHSLEAMQHQSMERDDEQDNYMLKRKRSNQRSQKERLVLDCMARLMADLDLVVAIETEDTATDWFLQTPMNEEGLLVGLEESTQTRLQTYLQSILNEMDTACPEEFFLSPTQIDTYGDTHQDLKQALQFILSILRIQGAENEWQCRYEVRTAMGLSNHAESPAMTVRGGDTSLFSLPEESMTPHTSNASMATTITSQPSSPQPHNVPSSDAVAVRRTIEFLTTILQRLSLSVKRLMETTGRASSPEAIRATEEMKRHYLQLMQLKNSDLNAVSDAFFQSMMPLVRTVSLEDEENVAPARHLLRAFDAGVQNNNIMTTTDVVKGVSHRIEEEEEDDDLRRLVGSNDYEECADEREGPESEVRDFYQQESCQV